MKRNKVFITGTDTGVGKTLVAAMLLAGMGNGYYWKPIQCGTREGTDTGWTKAVTRLPADRFLPETFRLQQPLSPHAAARKEGVCIRLSDFELPDHDGGLVVEGAGGIMVPISDDHLMLDLMKKLALPVIMVARSTLGTINHTLLSLDVLRRHGIDIIGVVMNGPPNKSNRCAIERYGRVRVILEIAPLPVINRDVLISHAAAMEI